MNIQLMGSIDCHKLVIVLGTIGLISYALADPTPVSPEAASDGNPTNQTAPAGSASTSASNSQNNSGPGDLYYQPASSDAASKDHDDHDLPVAAPKSKPSEHEKVVEVDSLQKLPTSGVDRKFQGRLIDASIDSIGSLSQETNKDRQTNEDPRFKTKQLSLVDQLKETESSSARSTADSSPSPTPSATASPTPKAKQERTQ